MHVKMICLICCVLPYFRWIPQSRVDPYFVHMILGTSVAAHLSRFYSYGGLYAWSLIRVSWYVSSHSETLMVATSHHPLAWVYVTMPCLHHYGNHDRMGRDFMSWRHGPLLLRSCYWGRSWSREAYLMGYSCLFSLHLMCLHLLFHYYLRLSWTTTPTITSLASARFSLIS